MGLHVFVHNPYRDPVSHPSSRLLSSIESDITFLNIGQHISALSAGCLDIPLAKDVLLVGSQTNILAYDIDNNKELFHNEVSDGANALLVGSHLRNKEPLVYVGGNCSITGFDKDGCDRFWTVTGDNVHSLSILDFNLDGHPELLIGSEDFDIRVYKDDELLCEISEADTVLSLCSLGHNKFGFALANGIVGAFSGENKLWRSKSKHFPLMVTNYDMNGDGVDELVTGWASGKVDIRSLDTGQILYKDVFSSPVAGITKADYRQDGKDELICCSVDGELRGYVPSVSNEKSLGSDSLLQELSQRKSNLLLELKNFEITQHIGESVEPDIEISKVNTAVGVIPVSTQIKTDFCARIGKEDEQPHIALIVETTNNIPIQTVTVFCDGLFDGESFVVHPSSDKATTKVEIPLLPDKDITYDLAIKTFVGNPNSSQFHVFETSRRLVKFCLYVPCPVDTKPLPLGNVVFNINERLDRVKSFIESQFLYGLGENAVLSPNLEVAYMSLRTNTPVFIKVEPSKNNKVTVTSDDMDLVGDIVQSMAENLGIEDLQSVAEFPKHMCDLKEIMNKIEEFHQVRETLSAEIADHASIIRNLIVRAEDARIMSELKNMKMAYMQLYDLNREIIRGYEIRRSNHMELLDCLKIVNQTVQKATRLRVGKPKTVCTSSCRSAIKDMNQDALIKAILCGTT
ncbi:PREDICTED: Bardet-Biedl syndrome 2 protein homolog [Amphimedon queenslandica]|uniref:Bardet-Biedl syndrome 2 protein homolog n=2 Tax=Amphimedon queenslandica TaxID=400682 RepID=A0AAN0ICB3_AMPQE|nr:PREDICTED: Bardet-Biedl syndrome 2 protein homolog [Amphimedon queenslandica]|eukprot:XP_003385146.1 PREDICTED: Bardet-Biedl syndrome 2 protein homolog [Amphimedon queenslandica]